jgi:BolA family transcriptional regulator, general stress-responsive regulator
LTLLAEEIEKTLHIQLQASFVEVEDESALHAGHAGAQGGGGHFVVTVVSEQFAGLPLIKQHRLVYAALAEKMGSAIHALSLKTFTPKQWQQS